MESKKCERYGCNDISKYKVIWTDSLGSEDWYYCQKHIKDFIDDSHKTKNNKIKVMEIRSNG